MTFQCREVAARVATGEDLGEELSEHASVCDDCAALLSIPDGLGEISACRGKLEPGPGFTSRVQRSAFRTLDRRRRVRVAGLATAAACVLVGLSWHAITATDHPDRELASYGASGDEGPGETLEGRAQERLRMQDENPGAIDESSGTAGTMVEVDTSAVTELAMRYDLDDALAYHANWDYIQEPLEPTWLLVGEGDLP